MFDMLSLLACLGCAQATPLPMPAAPATVDVELVLAVDISTSMDEREFALQRAGYVEAIRHPDFIKAVRAGSNGRIAIAYFEWAGTIRDDAVLAWQIIDGSDSANAFADRIAARPFRSFRGTSISGALAFGTGLFGQTAFKGERRVIDISGDGPNNNGAPVTIARDEALSKGIIINGLPIMVKEPSYSTMDIDNLDFYYEDCVIGGPGSFVVSIKDREKFKEAIRTKLLMEVAGRVPEPKVVPVAEKDREPRVSCLIGEKIWQDRWGR